MLRKASWLWILVVSLVALSFLAAGCSKKAVVKEEVAARPAPVVEAKVEPPPPPVAPPKPE
ncbi:MAG: hypothetical protein HXY45_16600, partial [Syntrophaceae bacterium]|nr:hypothetical protein [Syntrophaceae bacterium]